MKFINIKIVMLNSLLSDVAKHLIIFYNNPAILKNEIANGLVVVFLKIKLTSNSISIRIHVLM